MIQVRSRDQMTSEMVKWQTSNPQKTIGFVPTMGALHEGHGSLIQKARLQNDLVVLSIFVNRIQFNDSADYEKYPHSLSEDLSLAAELEVDFVFLPDESELYPFGTNYLVSEKSFSKKLCGAHRPGHFDGVLTVVLKLLQIVRPHTCYLGEKDYQQLLLISGMIADYFLQTKIVPIKTVRDKNGLALSSRNRRLSPQGRQLAANLFQVLQRKLDLQEAKEILTQKGFQVEYLEDYDNRRYAAVWLEGIRLIDNVELEER